jgi:hypothetical protein
MHRAGVIETVGFRSRHDSGPRVTGTDTRNEQDRAALGGRNTRPEQKVKAFSVVPPNTSSAARSLADH